jgi:phage portal protein BeeE
VSIVLTAPPDQAVESDVAGYLYRPGGPASKTEPRLYLPHEVAHWSPEPDPEAQYRGMSWLTPIIREIQADGSATRHKQKFFDAGASPKLAVSFKESVTEQQFKTFIAAMKEAHRGVDRAYETMFLGGGADVTTVGADLKQLDFKATQGGGETRITAAGGVPAVIVGLSEGLQAATYSNYGQARRKFGDHWARPQWRSAAAALATVVQVPDGARLWYDDRDIAFLREDAKDQAEILSRQMLTIESGVRAGYTPESVRDAVVSGDLDVLIHTGLFSVQLQPPGTGSPGTTSVEGGQSEDDDA